MKPSPCSRLPLAATIRVSEPAAAVAIALLDRTIRTHGRPRHLVTDQGVQFTAQDFRAFVRTQGIRLRYGKVGETHSLGLIDRFFRTLKDSLSLRSIRPWNLRDFRRRLTAALVHYAYLRPHTSLGGFTPIETYYGIRRHRPYRCKPGHPAAQPAGAAAAVGRPDSQSQGRGGDDERGLYTRSDQDQTACANAHAFLSRDEPEAAPGAALAYRRVRAAGAAARTRKLVHCKRRDGSAQRYIGRVIG